MTDIFVKPAPGGRVRMPERGSQVMPEGGAHVPDTPYYQALLAAGDVVLADVPSQQPAKQVGQPGTPRDGNHHRSRQHGAH